MNIQKVKLFARILLGTLLIWAALSKLANPTQFLSSLYAYDLPLSNLLLKIAAVVIPWMELLCGLLLVTKTWLESALLCAAALLLLFLVSTGQAWIRGLQVSCGCFDLAVFGSGTRFSRLAQLTEGVGFAFARNILLMAVVVTLAWTELRKVCSVASAGLLGLKLHLRCLAKKARPRIVAVVVAVCAFTALLAGWLHLTSGPEPYFDGKPLNYWVRHLDLERYPAESLQAFAAVRRAGTNAAPLLTRLLESKDFILKLGLKRLLSFQSLWKPDFELSSDRKRLALRAVTILGPRAENCLPSVAELFLAGKLPMETANALASIGTNAVPTLVEGLHSSSLQVRFFAAQALRDHGEELRAAAAEPLLYAIRDQDADVRLAVAQALRLLHSPPPGAVDAYRRSLGDSSKDVRIAVCQALTQCPGATVATPKLIELLQDSDSDLRQQAAKTLLRISPDELTGALLTALLTGAPNSRTYAAELLGQMTPETPRAVGALTQALHDENAHVRFFAAHALGRYGQRTEDCFHELETLQADENPAVQSAARFALARIVERQNSSGM